MNLNLDPATFRDLVTDPNGTENLSAAIGIPLVIVDACDCAAAAALDGLDITAIPAVVVLVAPDPRSLPSAAFRAADMILTEDAQAGAPFVTPAGGIASGVAEIGAVLESNPVAGTCLAMLLRYSADLPVPAALVAESATYSALQEGAEFRRWRARRPPRDPEPEPGQEPVPMPGTDRVQLDRAGAELTITLNRPARRNALDWRMRDALTSALAGAAADPRCRIVLRGRGPDFCAGGDLDEFGSRPDPAIAHVVRLTRSPARLMHAVARRTTAYLHGSCLGAGIELPAFASRVIAAPDARIGLPEVQLGLVPGAGGTASLPRRIGRWRTAYLALTGQVLGAQEALSWGLIDEVRHGPLW